MQAVAGAAGCRALIRVTLFDIVIVVSWTMRVLAFKLRMTRFLQAKSALSIQA